MTSTWCWTWWGGTLNHLTAHHRFSGNAYEDSQLVANSITILAAHGVSEALAEPILS
jgi:hypothetical protein